MKPTTPNAATQPLSRMAQKLATAAATPAASPVSESRMRAALPGLVRGEDVTLPVFGDVRMNLVPHHLHNEIESAVLHEMKRLDIAPGVLNSNTYEVALGARMLAQAVRCPDDHAQPFGTTKDWLALDDDLIIACFLHYRAVRDRLDPFGAPDLDDEEVEDIRKAIEKKNRAYLMRCGVAALSAYLLTTESRPASSATPPSTPGESSPGTSSDG